jgi:regulator of nonsense transcripts 2
MAEEVENGMKQEEEEEESSRPTEEEKLQAMKSLEELNTKLQLKKEFKEKNLTASANRPKEDDLRKLDGSIKKNTAFTKKLREMTESKRDSLTAEFKNLNLTKYIQEAATNIAEAKLKVRHK